jgi:predicted homoserine dehydrogenase-like protein
MFGINDALRERESQKGPIRVAIIGAGTMGGYMVHQLMTAKGMNPDIVIDVDVERAKGALTKAGIAESVLKFCHTPAEVATTIKEGKYASRQPLCRVTSRYLPRSSTARKRTKSAP